MVPRKCPAHPSWQLILHKPFGVKAPAGTSGSHPRQGQWTALPGRMREFACGRRGAVVCEWWCGAELVVDPGFTPRRQDPQRSCKEDATGREHGRRIHKAPWRGEYLVFWELHLLHPLVYVGWNLQFSETRSMKLFVPYYANRSWTITPGLRCWKNPFTQLSRYVT